jgi:hypothetical protein
VQQRGEGASGWLAEPSTWCTMAGAIPAGAPGLATAARGRSIGVARARWAARSASLSRGSPSRPIGSSGGKIEMRARSNPGLASLGWRTGCAACGAGAAEVLALGGASVLELMFAGC